MELQTLASTLRAFVKLQQKRSALAKEIDLALTSFLDVDTPAALSSEFPSPSACAEEASRPPNEAEMGEVLRIGLGGLLEVKDEAEVLATVLRVKWQRGDFADILTKIEGLETERLKETLRRDQLRRLAVLEPTEDFRAVIASANTRCQTLSQQINDEMGEIFAELADLSATSEDN